MLNGSTNSIENKAFGTTRVAVKSSGETPEHKTQTANRRRRGIEKSPN